MGRLASSTPRQPLGAWILDAATGVGRVGGRVAALGHLVVGVAFDPVLIAAAERDHPGPTWRARHLAEPDLPADGLAERFRGDRRRRQRDDVARSGHPGEALHRLRVHLASEGRVVVGFGAGRGYGFNAFFADASSAGLDV